MVARYVATPTGGTGARPPVASIVRAVKRSTKGPWFMRRRRCLREGLLAYRFLGLAGHAPTIHFAVDRTSLDEDVASGHCWVTVDGRTVINPPSPGMVEVVAYDPDGTARRSGRGARSVD